MLPVFSRPLRCLAQGRPSACCFFPSRDLRRPLSTGVCFPTSSSSSPPSAANCLSVSNDGGSDSGGRLGPLGITARFFPHDPGGSPKADYRSKRWLLIPEGLQRWHAILAEVPITPQTPPAPARLSSLVSPG